MNTENNIKRDTQTEHLLLPKFSLWQKENSRRPLFSFELELTARCNNNCRHCYINLPATDKAAGKRELTAAEILGIAEEAADIGALWCLMTGGEPLLRPDFEEIYIGLKKLGILVSLFTNATLIGPKHIALFQKYPPRSVEVTAYGATMKTYEAVTRRPGSFSSFMRGIDMLSNAGIKMNLKTVAIRSNLKEIPAIVKFCSNRSAEPFRFDPQLHLRLDRNPERNREILQERLSPEEITDLELTDPKRMTGLQTYCRNIPEKNEALPSSSSPFACRAGLDECTIGWDGALRLCNSLNHPDYTYDLRKGSLKNAWHHFIPMKRSGNGIPKAAEPECNKCRLLPLCMWCPAHAFLESGDMCAPVKYFCDVAEARERIGKKTVSCEQ